ncbi:dil and ankyrin domain containing protein [Moniliophthora roreri]|uniref:Dilute domain-containing protein n=1 Tax=Moniliophthora roreri TaxID=221103 RepID=A0A0W0FGM9_MONRR|nr:dil and ankyrin domain containing protein [Moniliophthora roreri]
MLSPSSSHSSFDPEPDLQPAYPTPSTLTLTLSSHSGLSPDQKTVLVQHSLTRACVYGDLGLLQWLLVDGTASQYADLSVKDEDGVGLVSLTIHGFGRRSPNSDSVGMDIMDEMDEGMGDGLERDVEREECVRLLIAQGADVSGDNNGWTPLHHAALFSPPTLITYLIAHGLSPFATTHRGLTPLDIITAYSPIPGRADVALLLEESMRSSEGETLPPEENEKPRRHTSKRIRMEERQERRKRGEEKMKRKRGREGIRESVSRILGVPGGWWRSNNASFSDQSDSESENEDGHDHESDTESESHFSLTSTSASPMDDSLYTPPPSYTSMLVFSPGSLPEIFNSTIRNYPPTWRDATPANLLWMFARFACLTCDANWLEDFILGATEAIEDVIFAQPDSLPRLVFWLYNSTIWLHLMQCDNSINEACEMLGSFELVEETVNSVFVFIIRLAERKIDSLLDSAILDYEPPNSLSSPVQFESEWSFLRPFTSSKKKSGTASNANTTRGSSPLPPQTPTTPVTPLPHSTSPGRPASPSPSVSSFSSIRSSFSTIGRARSGSAVPLQQIFTEPNRTGVDKGEGGPSPAELTEYLAALHTMLILSNINPALITQMWSQVVYWTGCEIFNRILTRKKYICRSKALQISLNLSVLEEWVIQMGLPRGVGCHLKPVRELVGWLQCLSSITEFPDLVATIQTMKSINPLQMRRAVRDYKYEVNEGRMTEECVAYLTQLQKDWERHRVKLGVEALRREQQQNNHSVDREGSISPPSHSGVLGMERDSSDSSLVSSTSSNPELAAAQEGIDMLFSTSADKSAWEPVQPPKVLGELLDSRYMLPLVFPSDPKHLEAVPWLEGVDGDIDPKKQKRLSRGSTMSGSSGGLKWRKRNRKVREVGSGALKWVDGVSAGKWGRPLTDEEVGAEEEEEKHGHDDEEEQGDETLRVRITPLTRKSSRGKGRPSTGGGDTTPVERTTFKDQLEEI